MSHLSKSLYLNLNTLIIILLQVLVHFLHHTHNTTVQTPREGLCQHSSPLQGSLFLVGSTWFIELGGLEKEHLEYLNENTTFKQMNFTSSEYLGRHVLRFKVDIPNSEHAPPLAAITPVLDALSAMGLTLLSHNDESRPNRDMIYLTWILQKEQAFPTAAEVSNVEEE